VKFGFPRMGVGLNVWRVSNYDLPTTWIKHAVVHFDRIARFWAILTTNHL